MSGFTRIDHNGYWWQELRIALYPPTHVWSVGCILEGMNVARKAEGWTSSTGESTTEAPSVTTHAESPLTSDPCSSPFGPGHLFNAVHNPPVVRYLVKKSVPVLGYDDGSPATSALKSLDIIPGQAIISGFPGFIGREGYRHVAPRNPTSDNASRIRMWTVSSSHPALTQSFSLTMDEMTGGAAARARSEGQLVIVGDTSPSSLTITIVDLDV
ncbi:hypothetical protein ARMGADRAFT_1087894 [Armillaria gallica]|uniref:Uncharacterized protein n=1 Tax=Armillaria gallica TaxID=47427 RepID=A0A2H3DBX3_ARMGA|nr:hypothetical protein ARMGADRAFT_1087894 [Armillaria gallica]